MDSDTSLDFAQFQLSPRRSRCELFVSKDGKMEKLAAGQFKPFLTHLKAAEEQETQSNRIIKLEVERKHGNAGSWFHRGTLERFVRFVSTPEVLEVISTLDAETSQLEGAKRTYCEGVGDHFSRVVPGESTTIDSAPSDITKKELLRAIDVRLAAVKQELSAVCARASAAGFTLESISDLRLFADYFGAQRLNIACSKFLSLCQRRPELITRPQDHHHQTSPPITWKRTALGTANSDVRGSCSSDMSIEDPEDAASTTNFPSNAPASEKHANLKNIAGKSDPVQRYIHKSSSSSNIGQETSQDPPPAEFSKRLSVQDRISMFESKQKEQSGGRGSSRSELKRQSSDLASVVEKAVLRRWSCVSDMSLDLSGGNSNCSSRKEMDVASDAPSSSSASNARVINNDEKDTADSQPCSSSSGTVLISESQLEIEGSQLQQVQDSAAPLKPLTIPSSSSSKWQKPVDAKVSLSCSAEADGVKEAINAEAGQRFPPGEAEEIPNQSFERNAIRKPKTFGKLARASEENRPKEKDSDLQKCQISVSEIRDETLMRCDSGSGLNRNSDSSSIHRPHKCSQGLNEELQMKADELEKIFAAHKLRLKSDQGSVSKRGKTLEKNTLQGQRSPERGPEIGHKVLVDGNQVNVGSEKKSLLDAGFPEGSRGKFYEKYVQKREIKLRDEWDSKRVQKEGRMKKMQDDLESSKAEMARLTRSAGKLGPRTNSRRREEKPGGSSYSLSQADLSTNKDDDERSSSSQQAQLCWDMGDNFSRTTSGGVSVSNHRTPVRDMATESVPSFVEFRKENAKPSPSQGKDGAHSLPRSTARSKSISEDICLTKEEKNSRLSQSMRRPSPFPNNMITPGEVRPQRSNHTRVTQGLKPKPSITSRSALKLEQVTGEETEEQDEATVRTDSLEDDDDDGDDDEGDLDAVPVDDPASGKLSTFEASADLSGNGPSQTDVSRLRKKWGSTQKPLVAANSSNQLQKDSPSKGFKRLLTLGRKQKGLTDSQIIAGDDYMEDGRNLVASLNEKPGHDHISHLRYAQDGFNDRVYEHGARSLFSVSSIRTKGARARPV